MICFFIQQSTSSWGRELKYDNGELQKDQFEVDLFVRSWVEMFYTIECTQCPRCRPLREVVSWNTKYANEQLKARGGRPLREVVSWNKASQSENGKGNGVDLFVRSWVEIKWAWHFSKVYGSTSSWGRELKYISCWFYIKLACRRPLREVVSWNTGDPKAEVQKLLVDLFVRSWVEILGMYHTTN